MVRLTPAARAMLTMGLRRLVLVAPRAFPDEQACIDHLKAIRCRDGEFCPHCGGMDRITKVKANPAKRIREGLWRCGQCKGQFTVKIGTVFELSLVT